MRLLVVDDEAVGVFMARVLSNQGFAVDVVTNGEAAKSLLDINNYEVVFVDVCMPRRNGQQLYEYIKTTHPLVAHKVVFISGQTADADTIRFIKSENRPFLNKPFGAEALKDIVGKTLQAIEWK